MTKLEHRCPECDIINKNIQKCRICGKPVGVLYDLCNECKLGADMNEDLQGLINKKRKENK